MNGKVYIYTLSEPDTGFVRYIGKATNLQWRLYQHKSEKGSTRKCNWIKSLAKRGLTPVIEILETLDEYPESDWQEAERFWIESLRMAGCNLVNLDIGGIGGGRKSHETKMNISAAKKGRPISEEQRQRLILMSRNQTKEQREKNAAKQRGRKASEQARANMRAAKKGFRLSPEAIARAAATRTGQKRTPEQCKRISIAHLGIKQSPESRMKKAISMTGKKHTAEAKLKMSLASKARITSDATREKLRAEMNRRWEIGIFKNRPYVNPWPTRRANLAKLATN